MSAAFPRATQDGWKAVIFASVFTGLAALSLLFTQNAHGFAYIWPSSGVAVAGFLLLRGRARFILAFGIAVGSVFVNLAFGTPLMLSTGFTVANLVEVITAAAIARTGSKNGLFLDKANWLGRFASGAAIASVISGFIAWMTMGFHMATPFFITWVSTVFLGILLVAPAVIWLTRLIEDMGRPKRVPRGRVLALGAVFLAALLVTAVTFGQGDYPLLFLPLVVIVFATVLVGIEGAVISVLVVAIAGSIATANGYGSVSFVDGIVAQTYFFQFYLLTLLGSAFPIASVTADRRRKSAELADSRDLLNAAAQIANVGHWRYELAGGTVEWSDQLYRIYGLESGSPVTIDEMLEPLDSDDRERIVGQIEQAVEDRQPFDFEAALNNSDGEVRHVAARGHVEVEGKKVVAIFGVLMDVSERVLLVESLNAARKKAEHRAVEALVAAETDSLTGVANRRKAMERLNEAVANAQRGGKNFSVVLIDADNFKSINDRFGHSVGDLVLKNIAQTCSECLRPDDLFARFGGEEFLVVLPGAGKQRALRIAERLRAAISEIRLSELKGSPVTISLGVAVHDRDESAEELLKAVDDALYQAKSDGRNRFALAA